VKQSQPLPGIEPPIIQPVAKRYTTELSRLPDDDDDDDDKAKVKLFLCFNSAPRHEGVLGE
jgi:hypothetical protein